VTRRRVRRRVRSARNKSSFDREFAGRIFVKDTAACIGKAIQVVQSVSEINSATPAFETAEGRCVKKLASRLASRVATGTTCCD
jgi:translation initiation factor 1 (eIF-1/SUI1)